MVFKRRNLFYAMGFLFYFAFFFFFSYQLSTSFICSLSVCFFAIVKIYIFCKREQDLPFNFSLIGKIMDIACFVACVAPLKAKERGMGKRERKKMVYKNTHTKKNIKKTSNTIRKVKKKPPTTTTTYRAKKMNGVKHRTELYSIAELNTE